ncbi:hypothetical protein DSECCO2_607370 [anaerobic digester metagenome]
MKPVRGDGRQGRFGVDVRGGAGPDPPGHSGRSPLHPPFDPDLSSVEEGVQGDRDDRGCDEDVCRILGQDPEIPAHGRKDERELTDLPEDEGHGERHPERVAHQDHQGEGRERLTEQDDRESGEHQRRRLDQALPVKEHADRDEEEDGKCVPHGKCLCCCPQAEVGTADHHPGEEGPEGHGDVEEQGRTDRDAERDRQHGERKELA